MVDGFGAAFDQIRARETPPDHVIVELSGLAEPDRVRPWGKSAGFSLDGVVVLVDADQFYSNQEGVVGSRLRTQVTQADQLILTKLDLVTDEMVNRIRNDLNKMAPEVPIIGFENVAATAGVLRVGGRAGLRLVDPPQTSLFDAHTVSTVPFPSDVTLSELETFLDGLGKNVVRAKGITPLDDGTVVLVQLVGRRRTITEISAAESQGSTDLVIISVTN